MIRSFIGEYRFLSNFYTSFVEFDGEAYRTVEHAYQAAKTDNLVLRKQIEITPTPGRAKALGRRLPHREGWENMKLDVMEDLLRKKFRITGLRDLLADTYPHELIEGNTWGDTFWGVCNSKGKNHLGKLLMIVRHDILRFY